MALVASTASCAGAVGSSGAEDKARRDVPVAICRRPLAAGDTTDTGAPRPEIYWRTLFPTFQGFGAPVDPATPDCVGEALLASPGSAAQAPGAASAGDATISPGDEGLQLVWLRPIPVSALTALGPLAVVRPRAAELDVYGIGAYRGSSRHSRFEFGKVGTTRVVLARDEACADVKPGVECESVLSIYLVSGGRLTAAARTSLERIQPGTMKDVGRVQSRLTTEPPVFDATSVHIKEKLSVRDSGDEEVRRSEGERVFTLRGAELVPNVESIWAQVGSR
jgi:hypothetical protein